MEFKIDITKLNNTAHNKPLTPKPSTSLSAINIIIALRQKRNKPNVKMVIGMVTIINNGFTKAFNIANTIATITEA